jgi:hypothetical protein
MRTRSDTHQHGGEAGLALDVLIPRAAMKQLRWRNRCIGERPLFSTSNFRRAIPPVLAHTGEHEKHD